ncbi:MAG TPA: hypothetical protein DIS90_06660 [Cytophagales bacterium]|nr:hypothetical protein [Cytophagales bacterium]HCR55248.1 hypothetical protein [Cytophagales bacterium]
MKTAAKLISVVFHPLLMTTYLFVLLTYFLPVILQPARPSLWIIVLIFVTTFALPTVNFLLLKLTGSIQDLSMPDRQQRILPFIFISAIYIFVTLMFYWKFPIPNLLRLMVIVTTMVVAATIITFFYKLSIHSLAMWGAVGMMLPMNKVSEVNSLLMPTAIVIVLAGLVMSSRLSLNAHTPREVMMGSVAGFSIGFFGMIILF